MHQFPPDAHIKGGQAAAPALAQIAREFYAPIIPIVVELRRQGFSLRAIARELEQRGIQTHYGWQRWNACQIRRVLARAQAEGHQSDVPKPDPPAAPQDQAGGAGRYYQAAAPQDEARGAVDYYRAFGMRPL